MYDNRSQNQKKKIREFIRKNNCKILEFFLNTCKIQLDKQVISMNLKSEKKEGKLQLEKKKKKNRRVLRSKYIRKLSSQSIFESIKFFLEKSGSKNFVLNRRIRKDPTVSKREQ